jgi:hypothetical protein
MELTVNVSTNSYRRLYGRDVGFIDQDFLGLFAKLFHCFFGEWLTFVQCFDLSIEVLFV